MNLLPQHNQAEATHIIYKGFMVCDCAVQYFW